MNPGQSGACLAWSGGKFLCWARPPRDGYLTGRQVARDGHRRGDGPDLGRYHQAAANRPARSSQHSGRGCHCPDSRWLATAGDDQAVRIWDPVTLQIVAMIRIDDKVNACAWLGTTGLALASQAGVHVFDFPTDRDVFICDSAGIVHPPRQLSQRPGRTTQQ